MARLGFMKRLAEVWQKVKARLYREFGSLLQGDGSIGQAGQTLALFCRLNDLELEDGGGGASSVC